MSGYKDLDDSFERKVIYQNGIVNGLHMLTSNIYKTTSFPKATSADYKLGYLDALSDIGEIMDDVSNIMEMCGTMHVSRETDSGANE